MTNLEATEAAELADMHYLLGSMLFRINNLAVQWSYAPPVPDQQEPLYYIPEVQAPTAPQPDMVVAQEPDVQQYDAVEPQADTFVPAVEQTAVPEADAFQPVVEVPVVPVRPMRPAVSAPVRPPMPRQIPKLGNDFNSRLNKILNS